jgi:hypothetical protein
MGIIPCFLSFFRAPLFLNESMNRKYSPPWGDGKGKKIWKDDTEA